VARRTRGGVRRPVVLGCRQQLRDQHEQDDLASGGYVRPGAPARTQGNQEQGGEFAPQRPLA
jgi:hypothetical protein